MSHPELTCFGDPHREYPLALRARGDAAAVVPPAGAPTRTAAVTALRAEAADARFPHLPADADAALLASIRQINGRYRGRCGPFELELWVDIELTRRKNCVSGDFYRIEGELKEHYYWFFVRTSAVQVTTTQVVVKGLGRFPVTAGAPLVKVSLSSCGSRPQGTTAVVEFLTSTLARGTRYVCAFESEHYSTAALGTCAPAGEARQAKVT